MAPPILTIKSYIQTTDLVVVGHHIYIYICIYICEAALLVPTIYVNIRELSSGFKVGPGGAVYHIYINTYNITIIYIYL